MEDSDRWEHVPGVDRLIGIPPDLMTREALT